MEIKKKLREKLYNLSLALTHKTPAEISAILKKTFKKEGEKTEIKEVPISIRFIVPFIIVFLAFIPTQSFLSFSILVIIFIVLIVLFFILSLRFGALNFIQTLIDLFIPTITIMVVLLICYFIGSPDYFKLSKKVEYGFFIVFVFFIISLAVAGIISYYGNTYTKLSIGCTILISVLFFIIPFIMSSISPYSICMQLPYISQYCNPREVRVKGPEIVKVPLSGGIALTFSLPQTLYAGEPFDYTFTLINYYEDSINFQIKKSYALSTYGSKVKFVYPFTQRINVLKRGEFYQDGVLVDPSQFTVEGVEGCPYYEFELENGEKVECAKDKPCGTDKESCIKIGYKKCECADWLKATCSGSDVKLGMEIQHTGFLIGNASLYYSSVTTKPAPAFSLLQGPLNVTIEFQPNPYIGPLHYYRNDISMYVTIASRSGDIVIDEFNVTPLTTIITTIDREKKKKLVETVGTEVIWCEDVSGTFIPSREGITKLFCKLKPPHVKTELIDLESGQTIELNNVSFDRVVYYCNKIKPNETENKTGHIFWSNYWEKIYQSIEESGLCEMLKKEKNTTEETIVENSLKFVSIYIGVNYTRHSVFESSLITPYTRTEECINFSKKQK
ncbi:MAG: hypothetical protein QXG39_03730 [Candidatus Aenigmatarchaeota archaeon]